ncbi:hypothetical protein D9M70_643560 [compost metagenome]
MVDRIGTIGRGAGHVGKPEASVDGVVESLRAVVPAHDPHSDQVRAALAQRFMGQEAVLWEIGDEQARFSASRRDDVDRKAAALRP